MTPWLFPGFDLEGFERRRRVSPKINVSFKHKVCARRSKINNIGQILKAFKQCTRISRLFLFASFRVRFYSFFVKQALAALFRVAAFAVYIRASVPSAFPRTFLKFAFIERFFGVRVLIAVRLFLRFIAGGLHFSIFFMENWTCPECGKLSPVSFDFAITDWSPRFWNFCR